MHSLESRVLILVRVYSPTSLLKNALETINEEVNIYKNITELEVEIL